jgi:hypothetical protein
VKNIGVPLVEIGLLPVFSDRSRRGAQRVREPLGVPHGKLDACEIAHASLSRARQGARRQQPTTTQSHIRIDLIFGLTATLDQCSPEIDRPDGETPLALG